MNGLQGQRIRPPELRMEVGRVFGDFGEGVVNLVVDRHRLFIEIF